MKCLIPILLILFVLTSCKKSNDVKPSGKKTNVVTNNPVPSAPIDTDAFIHQISFNAPFQIVLMSVADSTLTMIYYEHVEVLIPKDGYTLSYAIHLNEDFSHSSLKNFDYTTVDIAGNATFDWVDDNLNNVATKTVTDTTVNNVAMKKVDVARQFTFAKTYADNAAAVAEQDSLFKVKKETISLSSYVYFTKTYPTTTVITSVDYLKK